MSTSPPDPAVAAAALMLLREVAGQFNFYAAQHQQKGTLDGAEKSSVNAMWRDRCLRVLEGHVIPPEPTARAYEYAVEILDASGTCIRSFRTWLPQEPIGYGMRMVPVSTQRASCETRTKLLTHRPHSTA